jgi:hypothetical protein
MPTTEMVLGVTPARARAWAREMTMGRRRAAMGRRSSSIAAGYRGQEAGVEGVSRVGRGLETAVLQIGSLSACQLEIEAEGEKKKDMQKPREDWRGTQIRRA